MDCKVGDDITRFPVELRIGSSPTLEAPAPRDLARPSTVTSVRPALSENEMWSLSNEESSKKGYPHRPDPKKSPSAFDVWKKHVSRQITLIKPQVVIDPDVRHVHNLLSKPKPHVQEITNWSGASQGKLNQCFAVVGKWHNPSIVLTSSGGPGDVSIWIGIDGDGPGVPLTQTGIDIRSLNINGNLVWAVKAFYEFWPRQPMQIINYDLKSGDEMFVSLEITDSAGNPTPGANGSKYFMADNNDVGIQPIAEPLNYNPTGTWAEWIVERPTQADNTFAYLPQFTDVDFHDCSAQDNNPQHIVHRPCDLDTMNELVMVDYPALEPTQGNQLSVISLMGIPDDPGRFNVSWRGFGTPGPIRP